MTSIETLVRFRRTPIGDCITLTESNRKQAKREFCLFSYFTYFAFPNSIFQPPRVRRSRGRRASWGLLRDLHGADDR